MKALKILASAFAAAVTIAGSAAADQRPFTYTYEAGVLPEGASEIEQWVTNQNGRDGGDYSRWDLRTEFEHGITDRLQTALYLNLQSVRTDEESDFDFKGVSTEWVYQLLNPVTDPIGFALYGEYTTDGIDHELEGKLLFSKNIGNVVAAINAIYEAEWEREDRRTEEEAVLEFTGGVSYRLNPKWALGVEARNKSAYPDGLNLSGQEFQTWSVGPVVHYSNPKWWASFTVLPQVWGNGDGASGSRNLAHEEELEVRLIAGVNL